MDLWNLLYEIIHYNEAHTTMKASVQFFISRLRYDMQQRDGYYDKEVAVLISDAKKLRTDKTNIRIISRRTYDFAVLLEEHSGSQLYSLDEYRLNRDVYKKLMKIFDSI